MTKKKSTLEVIEKIKKDEIKPVPKWQCWLFNGLIWLGVVLAVFMIASFVSLIFLNLWEIPFHLGSMTYWRVWVNLFPLLWAILVVVFLGLGFWIFNKTKRAYRYQMLLIFVGLIFSALALSFVFNRLRIDHGIRNFTDRNFPQTWMNRPFDRACHHEPLVEKGLLGGEIVERGADLILIKNDFDENWRVIVTPETRIKRRAPLLVGDKVMVIGDRLEDFVFEAWVIKRIEDFGERKGCDNCN
jgi:hypothetical protein